MSSTLLRPARTRSAVALVGLAVALLSGCGDDDDDTTTQGSSTPPAVASTTAAPPSAAPTTAAPTTTSAAPVTTTPVPTATTKPSATRTPVPAQGRLQVVMGFLEAWNAGDVGGEEAYATRAAIAQFKDVDPKDWASSSIDDTCTNAKTAGPCGFSLISKEGGGFSYSTPLVQVGSTLLISRFTPLGGGA